MSAFADTSFLFAIYLPRAVSEQTMAKVESLQDAPLISSLVRFEFQQAVWFKVWLRANGNPGGLNETDARRSTSILKTAFGISSAPTGGATNPGALSRPSS